MPLATEPAEGRLLRINLFGSAAVACGSIRVEHRFPASTLLLLALLVLRPGVVSRRDEVAFTLWPDRSEREARANLRRHLYTLQNELPASAAAFLTTTSKTVAWEPRDAWIDALEFERLRSTSTGVEAAVYLYDGDFLPHVDHEWARARREAFRQAYCAALERAIACRSEVDDVVGALRYVEALLAVDAWREDALRRLMVLRTRIGDRAGALAAYDGFRRRIRSELGADPMAETIAWRDAIAVGTLPVERIDRAEAFLCA